MLSYSNESKIDLQIKRAAQLGLTEVSLGSIGHGFKIPFTGHVLSLNQLAFLLNAFNKDKLPKATVFEISAITSILKSFSPAGQKLGPMLSINMQGFLFWLGVSMAGAGLLGQLLGAFLLTLWAFVQPFISLVVIYGFDFFKILQFYLERLNEDFKVLGLALKFAVCVVVSLKIFIGFYLTYLSYYKRQTLQVIPEVKNVFENTQSLKSSSALRGAVKDMLRPLFLLSFILTLVFFIYNSSSVVAGIWRSLRPLATAFILFYLVRNQKFNKVLFHLSMKFELTKKIYLKAQLAFDLMTQRSSRSTEVSSRREGK